MGNSSQMITAYLAASRWTKGELARRAGLSPSAIARLIHGRKTRDGATFKVGELVAIKIERATVEAYVRGETKADPIRAAELLATNESSKREAA